MTSGRTQAGSSSHMERLGSKHHRESMKRDLIRMSRGDHDLLTARKRASSSLSDLMILAAEGPLLKHATEWRLGSD